MGWLISMLASRLVLAIRLSTWPTKHQLRPRSPLENWTTWNSTRITEWVVFGSMNLEALSRKKKGNQWELISKSLIPLLLKIEKSITWMSSLGAISSSERTKVFTFNFWTIWTKVQCQLTPHNTSNLITMLTKWSFLQKVVTLQFAVLKAFIYTLELNSNTKDSYLKSTQWMPNFQAMRGFWSVPMEVWPKTDKIL